MGPAGRLSPQVWLLLVPSHQDAFLSWGLVSTSVLFPPIWGRWGVSGQPVQWGVGEGGHGASSFI